MFERFTDRARRVVVLAQEEAKELNHGYIGTEHILLGMIQERDGVAAQALKSLDISLTAVRERVEEIMGSGAQRPTGAIPFTPRARKVLELALREALLLGHNYIGTEHILLGLIREGEGIAAQVLVMLGADLNRVCQQVIQLLAGYIPKHGVAITQSTPAGKEMPPIEGMEPLAEPEKGPTIFTPVAAVFTQPINVLVHKESRRKVVIKISPPVGEEIDILTASVTYRDGQGVVYEQSSDWSKAQRPKKPKRMKPFKPLVDPGDEISPA